MPDPTQRTIETLRENINYSREIVEAKIDGKVTGINIRLGAMDKAIELLQKSTDRIPVHIKEEVKQLEALHDERFKSTSTQLAIQFAGVQTQFQERDKRTEQLSLADKTAIAAALQAQKEDASAKNESNATATAKMENNFSELIKTGQTLLLEVRRNTEAQINDIKTGMGVLAARLDKGEGRTPTDPAVTMELRAMRELVSSLASSRDNTGGRQQQTTTIIAMAVAAVAVVGFLFTNMSGKSPNGGTQNDLTLGRLIERLESRLPAPSPSTIK